VIAASDGGTRPAPRPRRFGLGACFCGGESRRMGTDKALLSLGGRTLLERALGVLDGVADEVVLSVGARPRYPEAGRREVLDGREGGPLAGLGAVLDLVDADDWVAALACDLPRARAAVFEHLLDEALDRDLDACLLATEGGLEPLFAVYRGRCHGPVASALDAGERRMVSFHAGHGPLRVGSLPLEALPAEYADCALNVNTPAEWTPEAWASAGAPEVTPEVKR